MHYVIRNKEKNRRNPWSEIVADYENLVAQVEHLVIEVETLRKELELYKKRDSFFFKGEEFVTLSEAADFLNLSKRTLVRSIKSGKLQATKGRDRRWRIHKADLEYYFSRRSGVQLT